MKRVLVFLALFCLFSSGAEARPKHRHSHSGHHAHKHHFKVYPGSGTVYGGRPAGCPSAWCGCWLRQHVGRDPGQAFNEARAWKRFGSHLSGPQIGAVVIFPSGHHVGIITGQNELGWVVKSGNDGHAVRERVRSVAGATFRAG